VYYKNYQWQHPLVILLIFACLTGCSRWTIIQKPEQPYIMKNRPLEIEVELRTGEKLTMHLPFIRGDSLYGGRSLKYYGQSMQSDDTIGVSMQEIAEIKQKSSHPATKKIALLTTLLLLTGGLLTLIYFYARGSGYPEDGIG
jgi:hypothetical protein